MAYSREMESLAAARTAFQIGKPAGAIGRWTPARTASGAPAVVGVIFLQDVRLVRWPDGRWVAGYRLADHAGRHDPKYWDHLASGATLADAHAAAWRILQPMEPRDGVPMGPGWRK